MKSIFVFLFLIFVSCQNYSFQNLIGSEQLEINDYQIDKFHNYLTGNFYSDELKQKTSNNTPLIFAISKNGKSSLIISCQGIGNICNPDIYIYQSLKKYSKKLGNELYIFSIGRTIVWSNLKYNLDKFDYRNKNSLKNKILNLPFIDFKNNSLAGSMHNSYSTILLPQDNCGSDDC